MRSLAASEEALFSPRLALESGKEFVGSTLLAQGQREAASLRFDRTTGMIGIDSSRLGSPRDRLGHPESLTFRRFRAAIESVEFEVIVGLDVPGQDVPGGRTIPASLLPDGRQQIPVLFNEEVADHINVTADLIESMGDARSAGRLRLDALDYMAHLAAHEIGIHAARRTLGLPWEHVGTMHIPSSRTRWEENPSAVPFVPDGPVDAESHLMGEINNEPLTEHP